MKKSLCVPFYPFKTFVSVWVRALRRLVLAVAIVGTAWSLGAVPTTSADTVTIPDGDVVALIAAINTANSNGVPDVINLAPGGTYSLGSGLPVITSDITINGNGATVRRGDDTWQCGTLWPNFRILHVSSDGDLTLNDMTISHGCLWQEGQGKGGGIYNEGTLTVTGSMISDNHAGFMGGGIYNDQGTVTLIDTTVTRNTSRYGGGIFSLLGTLTVTATPPWVGGGISNNRADYGGGIYNQRGQVKVSRIPVIENRANQGGGIHNEGFLSSPSIVELENMACQDNFSYGHGGCIYNMYGTFTTYSVSIVQNQANSAGGGIYNVHGVVEITDTWIGFNHSNFVHGGGIYSSGYPVTTALTVIDSLIEANSARLDGGFLYTSVSGPVTVTGCIIKGNHAGNGGAVYIGTYAAGAVSVTGNCIMGNSSVSFYNSIPNLQTATGNWWGVPTGPNTPMADTVSGNVDYSGWLTSPILGCPNPTPTADAGGPYSVDEGSTIPLLGSGSDEDGDPLTFAWDLDDDGTFESPGQNVTFSAVDRDGPDGQTVVLQVCDSTSLCSTDAATVSVENVSPTVDAGPDVTIVEGDTLSRSGGFSDPASADTWTATVDYGDGSGEQPLALAGYTFDLDHLYQVPGVYTLSVSVTDDDLGVGTATAGVTVISKQEATANLIGDVEVLVDSGVLNGGQGNALIKKLEGAITKMDQGNTTAAANRLQAFVNQVNGFINGGILLPEEGQPLIDAAVHLIGLLND